LSRRDTLEPDVLIASEMAPASVSLLRLCYCSFQKKKLPYFQMMDDKKKKRKIGLSSFLLPFDEGTNPSR
jgi:hypothetical protein